MARHTKDSAYWTSKRVDAWMKDYANGHIRKDNPWADGMIGIRKPELLFEYTPEEIQEVTKCAQDIIYFANNYCYCMQGGKGYQPLTLRDYQENMLREYSKNRFNCTLAARQIGKCSFGVSLTTRQAGVNFHKYIEDVYLDRKKGFLYRIKQFLFNIYNKL